MNKGAAFAKRVYKDCGIQHPLDLTLEELVYGRGAILKSSPIDGAQGRIMTRGDEAIITYDNRIKQQGKKRFIIAHELGHYEMHRTLLENIHLDPEGNFCEWLATGRHEIEANQFAAELLMPSSLFGPAVKGKQFNLNLIKTVADEFQTSITATLLNYREQGSFPVAIVYSRNGRIEWTTCSESFVMPYIPKNEKIPVNSVANDLFKGYEFPSQPEEIDTATWFSHDYRFKEYRNWKFWEQCIQVAPKSVLSVIWSY